jgi:hypothetical protein
VDGLVIWRTVETQTVSTYIEQFVSSFTYIHDYNPSYLTIDIIYDISMQDETNCSVQTL